jgi:hypothetical protein
MLRFRRRLQLPCPLRQCRCWFVNRGTLGGHVRRIHSDSKNPEIQMLISKMNSRKGRTSRKERRKAQQSTSVKNEEPETIEELIRETKSCNKVS